MKFSIICPVYNGEQFLSEAITSVLLQTFSDWELLVINDCSLDQSRKIALEFSNKETKIKVIDNSVNKGQFYSRIEGINKSTGDVIIFMDADDKLDVDCLKKLEHEFSNNCNLDCVVYNCNQLSENNLPIQDIDEITDKSICFSNIDFYKNVFIKKSIPTVWRYCFKRLVLNKVVNMVIACDTKLGEDMYFLTVATLNVSNALLLPQKLYDYRLNPISICHTLDSSKAFDRFKSKELSYKYLFEFNKTLFGDLSYRVKNLISWSVVKYLELGTFEDDKKLFKTRCSIIRQSLIWKEIVKYHRFESKYPRIIKWCFKNHCTFIMKLFIRKYKNK